MTRWIINLVYLAAAAFYLPALLYQMWFQKKNRSGWRMRFGNIELSLPPMRGPRVWVHAVSLGEVNAARLVVERLRKRSEIGDVVISSTTDTGFARARELFGAASVFRYPLDFSWVIRRALDRIQPTMIVLVELEVWPNLVALAEARGIPVAVINGRMTARSCGRLRRFSWFTRSMFRAIQWVGAQDEATAERFRSVGVSPERVTVTGSVKWDTVTLGGRVVGQDELARAMGYQSPVQLWVCGSTGEHDGVAEEEFLLSAYGKLRPRFPKLHLAIIPRKPERFEAVAKMISRAGFSVIRRTDRPDGLTAETLADGAAVSLGDTMGELRKFYSLADVIFVGRSLIPLGGSDPMEVAALGKPMICGPHMENFVEPVERLREAQAVERLSLVGQASVDELVERVSDLHLRPGRGLEMGQRAQAVVRQQQGATERVVSHLISILR